MARIKIKSITINCNWVSGSDYLRIILCPFDNQGGDLPEITAKLEEKAAVFNDTLPHSKKLPLNIVLDYEFLDIHIFTKSRASNGSVYNYLDTCNIKNISVKNASKISKNGFFRIEFDTEKLGDEIEKSYLAGYNFQIFNAKCHAKEDYSDDEIRFEIIPDNDRNKKSRFPVNRSYFTFKKGQKRNFTGEDKILVKFVNEIKVIVWEIDSPDPNDNLGEQEFKSDIVFAGSFKADGYSADYDISYGISERMEKKIEERTEYSWELSSKYDKLNFKPFFDKINDAKERFSLLKEIQVEESVKPKPADTISSELNQAIKPIKLEDIARVNQFITEYYAEFLSNPNLQQRYIEELTHSQYPVMAYPVYPEPAYYYLKQISDRFILPASGSMPDNSMALFVNNPAFVEAFLCGMNTEMGRELLWREYPTDSRGSYFRKFWDTEVKKNIREEIRNDTFFDILPIHKWEHQEAPTQYVPHNSRKLGQNHTAGKDNLLIFAIKGELLKKYPETIIYLSKAFLDGDKIQINPDAVKILPDLSAWLSEDTYIVGFPADLNELTGNPATRNPGYFLTFMNRPGETRFGYYEDSSAPAPVNHAGDTAANLLVQPAIFGKHVSQFLSGWQNI